MAADEEQKERRSDTVAISRKAFNYFTSVAAAGTLVIAGALYNLAVDNARSLERLKSLEEFGPKTGQRFTWSDGKDIKEDLKLVRREIQQLREHMHEHETRNAHSVAEARMNKLDAELNECCGTRWNGGK